MCLPWFMHLGFNFLRLSSKLLSIPNSTFSFLQIYKMLKDVKNSRSGATSIDWERKCHQYFISIMNTPYYDKMSLTLCQWEKDLTAKFKRERITSDAEVEVSIIKSLILLKDEVHENNSEQIIINQVSPLSFKQVNYEEKKSNK